MRVLVTLNPITIVLAVVVALRAGNHITPLYLGFALAQITEKRELDFTTITGDNQIPLTRLHSDIGNMGVSSYA